MFQILQDLKDGQTVLAEVPAPECGKNSVLIETKCTLVSLGTERMLVDFGRSGLIGKALQQPEKVRQVIAKIKTDGIMPTINSIKAKLSQPMPLGYCNAGVVIGVGENVKEFKVGDRVVSNGPHAEIVSVPKNLCAKIPANVDFSEACFTVIASVALQGVRLVKPELGEKIVVTGLGLVGLLAAQFLKASGCDVLGLDFDKSKCELAKELGIKAEALSDGQNPVAVALDFSDNRGVDAVIVCASTKLSDPINQAAQMCRKKGRVIQVGLTGLELDRKSFYDKELSFGVSCSYGAGRYDSDYEERGIDYPFGYVRWTEQRNFEAVLGALSSHALDVGRLTTRRFKIADAAEAYNHLRDSVGIVLDYSSDRDVEKKSTSVVLNRDFLASSGDVVAGVIGAGNFSNVVMLPILSKSGAKLKTIVSRGGVSGTYQAKRIGFAKSSTNVDDVFGDSQINTVVITTRHDTHADFVLRALQAGKNVFVEKPLALDIDEIDAVEKALAKSSGRLMVGFNRRFSPHILKAKELLKSVPAPKSIVYTVNSGYIPPESWVQNIKVSGGRLVGEGCHFIDTVRFLAGAKFADYKVTAMKSPTKDTFSISLSFEDGSIGVVHYFSNGDKSFPKENIKIFAENKVIEIDNFRITRGYGWKKFSKFKTPSQNKGHSAEIAAFFAAVREGKAAPISADEIFDVSRISIELQRQIL